MNQSTAQHEIEAAYQKYFAALKAKDAAAMLSFIAPNFRWYTLDGDVMDAAQTRQILEEQVQGFVHIEDAQATFEDLSVEDDGVVFTVTETITGTVRDEAGDEQQIVSIDKFRDTMVKTPEGWQFSRAETISSQVGPPQITEPLPGTL
jgi:ketosteroid isomerase-like protein